MRRHATIYPGTWDAINLREKIAWRNKLFSLVKPPYHVVEYFTGYGHVTEGFWAKTAATVDCFELDDKKVTELHRKFGSNPNISITHADAFDHLDACADIEVVDCDAYGIVIDMMAEILKNSQTERKVIFFTDGTLTQEKAHHRSGQFEREIKTIGSKQEWRKASRSNVYLGYVLQ